VIQTQVRILEMMEELVRYRDWIFSLAAPHLGDRVLEIGAGTGIMTECLTDKKRVVALELEELYAADIRRRLQGWSNIEVVIGSATDIELMRRVASGVDSAMTFNVWNTSRTMSQCFATCAR
jgi:16S rRNA A1518/A1519 N6-dimethyltransferase RsmA/KsgA/DIM1 with predicted DNA glycosylase/AP lyase activity